MRIPRTKVGNPLCSNTAPTVPQESPEEEVTVVSSLKDSIGTIDSQTVPRGLRRFNREPFPLDVFHGAPPRGGVPNKVLC